MKNFLVPQSTDNIFDKISSSIKASNQWFFKTPERALEQAYQAALKIKAIEDEHFSGQKVAATSGIYSQNILSCFQADVDKYLNIIKIKIAEFEFSRLLLRGANYTFLYKLSFIDQILTKYQISAKEKPILQSLNLSEKLVALKSAYNSKSQVKSSEITLIDVKPINQKSGALPRSIGRTIGKIKTEINPYSEEELLQNFRRSRRITQQALNFFSC